MKKHWKYLIVIGICTLALVLAGTAAWVFAPDSVADPMTALAEQTPVRTWLDRNGKILWQERTYDAQWRFPVPLEQISPHVIRVILAAEDASFYRHGGVDYPAVLRAGWQNLTSGRRISGASTVSMQLAGMVLPGKHDFKRKFHQAVTARKMERLHSKEEILTEYLNRIPFGGKIYGIEAAAQYYFGLSASELNLAEATLLCGLPQKPNYYRPDQYLDRAKERQRIVLKLLVRRGKLTEEEARRILTQEPLRFRDFRYKAPFALAGSPGELYHALRQIPIPAGRTVHTTLDRELQSKVLSILKTHRDRLKDVQDSAALLIDNHTGEVLVYIGTLDFSDKAAGQVDAVQAPRSAGSTLKPFIYAEACRGGWLISATRLWDAPIRYGDYTPGNYDGLYHGNVTAAYALSRSLNTPAIRLVAMLGEQRVMDVFRSFRISLEQMEKERVPGLSIALGSDGSTLWNLTRAYAMLASGGNLFEPVLSRNTGTPLQKKSVLSREVCTMISSMLRERPFGYSGLDAAWKTGTSNNNCDAWCLAYTPDYTLGVWYGNKNGKRSPDLVGATAAVPPAAEIFELLYQGRPQPHWDDEISVLELRELCSKSGLTPGPFCAKKSRQPAIPGLPLRACQNCNPDRRTSFRVVSPAAKEYQIPRGREKILLKLSTGGKNAVWYLNNRKIGENLTEYEFSGDERYTLRAVEILSSPDEAPRTAEVIFSVKKAE